MKCHIREILVKIKKLDIGVSARILRQTTHVIIELRQNDVIGRITVGKTPTNTHHAILNAMTDVRKQFQVTSS